MNLNELPENPDKSTFDEIRKCFHVVLKTTRIPLPSFVFKYIAWLEKLVAAKIQKS